MPAPFRARQQYELAAAPDEVYRALTEPSGLVRWFLSGAKIDLRPGGKFGFDWIGGYHMDGEVRSLHPGSAVGFLWRDRLPSGAQAETHVDFAVTAHGTGSLLTLEHSGFTDPDHFAECASRWAYYLTNLKSVVDHGADLRSPGDW